MGNRTTFLEHLLQQGVSRRSFLRFCTITCSALALPAGAAKVMADTLATSPRPSVIWLSFQECTGCTESLTRAAEPTVASLILDHLSLDYHHTLQAAAGNAAEAARLTAMEDSYGRYVLVVDGSIPTQEQESWSTIAGQTNLQMLAETVEGAALVVAVGTCASFGGLPAATALYAPNPNQSSAAGVAELMDRGAIASRPLVNVPGCPPLPEVISGTIAHFLAYGDLPELDALSRPKAYFGKTVHDTCPRRSFFDKGQFALAYDDIGAKRGYCLLKLGCNGPETHNSCPTKKWNLGTSFPMHSGHGCLGCSEPQFWDRGLSPDGNSFLSSSFYPDLRPTN